MRDAAEGDPLRDYLRVIAEQVNVLEDDILGLYDNWFIETADDWAVAYIGDLVGWSPVDAAGLLPAGVSGRDLARDAAMVPRRDVANTVRHRRRKGTRMLLEDLAEDVAGWSARAVELYRLLRFCQHVDYLELKRGRTVDVRQLERLERINTPFDDEAHVVDVRRISSRRTQGLFNIPEVALFIWRLRSYSVTNGPACKVERVGRWAFTFNALGFDAPLFVAPPGDDRRDHPASLLDVPMPIGKYGFSELTSAGSRIAPGLYGLSLEISAPGWPGEGKGEPIPPENILPTDLSDWSYYRPKGEMVAVDPVLGRIVFPHRKPPGEVRVTYHYGFSADLGGGEYRRPMPEPPLTAIYRVRESHIRDAEALVLAIKAAGRAGANVIGHWPLGSRTQVDNFKPGDPVDHDFVRDLIEALNAALEDEELFTLGHPGDPVPSGGPLVMASRVYLEHPDRLGGSLKPARWYRPLKESDSLDDALRQFAQEAPPYGVVELEDSGLYGVTESIELADGQTLMIRAANERRPIVWLADRRADQADSMAVGLGAGATFTLDGVMVAGRPVHGEGRAGEQAAETEAEECVSCRRIVIRHCTLVPGWLPVAGCEPQTPAPPSLELVDLDDGCVEISHSILGAVQVTAGHHDGDPVKLVVSDSILDAGSPELEVVGAGGPGAAYVLLTIARATVFGSIHAHAVDLAEDSIFEGPLNVARRGRGCVRFSSIVPGSRTPRRFHCQPDLAVDALGPLPTAEAKAHAEISVRPRFTSTKYAQPGYAQLSCACPEEISRGADDESEMGAFHDLFQPQRIAALNARADEYTPAGMDVAVIPVT
jgi:hypothetical protein